MSTDTFVTQLPSETGNTGGMTLSQAELHNMMQHSLRKPIAQRISDGDLGPITEEKALYNSDTHEGPAGTPNRWWNMQQSLYTHGTATSLHTGVAPLFHGNRGALEENKAAPIAGLRAAASWIGTDESQNVGPRPGHCKESRR